VRRPSPRLAEGQVTHIDREEMNVSLALTQYEHYLAILERRGYQLVFAQETPHLPDGVFVEDTMFAAGEHLVVTRPGASSRFEEIATIEPLLRELGAKPLAISEPHTMDGGDVLVVDRHVFVGVSTRTTLGAVDELRTLLSPFGFTVIAASVTGCLHLKSAITRLPNNELLAVTKWINQSLFTSHGFVVHQAAEDTGGDILCLDQIVVIPANAPRTAQYIRSLGFVVEEIDVSELQKIEAGVTCMSVLLA
jgi:dimethylargininase